jgi:DNA modification methylase
MAQLEDNAATMTLTDIPFDVVNRPTGGIREFDKGDADKLTFDVEEFTKEVARVTGGSVYIFCSTEQVSVIRATLVAAGLTTRLCIWQKTNPQATNGQYLWLSGIETCVFGRKKKATFYEFCKVPVWKCSTHTRNNLPPGVTHKTHKPVRLMRYLIRSSSNPGDVIFDPCCGSGSTGAGAVAEGRKYLLTDINPEYCQQARDLIAWQGSQQSFYFYFDPYHHREAEKIK